MVTSIENWQSGKLESSLLSLTRKISKVSFISLFNDSNLFRNEFTLRCPRKTFLGCLFLKPLKFWRFLLLFFRLTIVLRDYVFSPKHWLSYSLALYVNSQLYLKQMTNFQSAHWFHFYLSEYHFDYSAALLTSIIPLPVTMNRKMKKPQVKLNFRQSQ